MIRKFIPLVILFLITGVRLVYFFELEARVERKDIQIPKVISNFSQKISEIPKKVLPPEHFGLLTGMTIGAQDIKNDKIFYDKLIQIGLVHVVVVSGYNVSLVLNFLRKIFYSWTEARNKALVLAFLVLYCLVCGLQPPVIRACVMGYISYLATTQGRELDSLQLLFVSCCLLLLVFPDFLISLSFLLSFTSTLGMIAFEKQVSGVLGRVFSSEVLNKIFPVGDLSTTLACQITVWPIISYYFGRVSLASPLYNIAILWLVPICTVVGFCFMFGAQILPEQALNIVTFVIYPPYDLFVKAVNFFAELDRYNFQIQITLTTMLTYYFVLLVIYLRAKSAPSMV